MPALFRRAAVCLAVVALSAAAQADTTLRWKFSPGQSVAYQQTIKMQMSLAPGLMNTMNQVIGTTWKVDKIDPDGKANMTQTIDSIKFDMDGPAGKAVFDSKSGEKIQGAAAALLNPIFESMIGGEFRFKVSPLGEISDVVVADKIKQELQKNPALAAMGGMFSDEGLKNMVSQSFLSFPTEPLAPGKTWNKEATLKQPFGTQTITFTYAYQGPASHEGKMLEKISVTPKVDLKVNPGGQVNIQIAEQKGSGEVLFDNQQGRIARLTLKQEMKMEIMVLGQKQQQQTMTETVLEPAPAKQNAEIQRGM